MPLISKLKALADEYNMLPRGGLILACVSGGADSMCLLEALLQMSCKCGFNVSAAHYNHNLRGDSVRDEEFVKNFCSKRNVPFYSDKGDVAAYASKNGMGIEEAARALRYGFFYETAAAINAARIATAHTSDDNAETIIMNLTRGTGTAGMRGIPPVRGIVVRPMLNVSREEVTKFLAKNSISHVEDPTNKLDIYTRNKIRHGVIPLLKEVNPRFNEAAASLAALARDDDEYLCGLAEAFISENGDFIPADKLYALPPAISGRVIRSLYGGSLSRGHVENVLKLCADNKPSGAVSIPGMTVYREYNRVVFGGDGGGDGFSPIYPEDGGNVIIPGLNLKMSCKLAVCNDRINKSLTKFLFKYIDLCGRITVRPRREGDKIKLYGREGTKTLKKLFIEHRIPARKRPLIPVISDEEGVLAVYGIGESERARAVRGDLAFEISFVQEGVLG